MFMQCLFLFGVLFLVILYLLLVCVLRVVDDHYEEYSEQFVGETEQQFFEEGKCT